MKSADIADLRDRAIAFNQILDAIKTEIAPEHHWYRYDTLSSLIHMEKLLTGRNRDLGALIAGGPIADLGAGDGDLSFFLEHEELCTADMLDAFDWRLQAQQMLIERLGSESRSYRADLNQPFELPRDDYSLIILFGILYHLKNPFYVLEKLSAHARHLLVSTRIAQVSRNGGCRYADEPMAYLLDAWEANDDDTNYWIFSDAGLKMLFKRTGWDVVDFTTVGSTSDSNPQDPDADERAFALLRSRVTAPPVTLLAVADELIANPKLIRSYARSYSERDAVTLAIWGEDLDAARFNEQLRPLLEAEYLLLQGSAKLEPLLDVTAEEAAACADCLFSATGWPEFEQLQRLHPRDAGRLDLKAS